MDRGPTFPEIGRIRKGAEKKEDENRPGKDLTYFRFEIDANEIEAIKWVKANFPPEPRELLFMLPFRTVEENFYRCREVWVAGGLIHRCSAGKDWDTGRIQFQRDPKGDTVIQNSQPEKFCDLEPVPFKNRRSGKTEEAHCKPTGRLKIFFPQMGRLVFFTLITGSIHDIVNLQSELEGYKNIGPNGLAGVPLILKRVPKKISTPDGSGGRARREKWMLHIEVHPDYAHKAIQALTAAAVEFPALEAPKNIREAEWSQVEEEPEPAGEGKAPAENWGVDQSPEPPAPPKGLTVDGLVNFAKENGIESEIVFAVLKENKGDVKKSWDGLLRSHIMPEDWPG
jgi:hypothetical protein